MYSETSLQFRKDRGRGAGCDIRLRKQQDMDINTFFFFSFFLQEDFIHIGVVFHFKRWTFYLSSDTFYSNENIDQIIL